MKTYVLLSFLVLASCNDNTTTKVDTAAPGEAQNPSAIDTTQHPNGLSTGSVISTDTAAMRVKPQQ